MVTFI